MEKGKKDLGGNLLPMILLPRLKRYYGSSSEFKVHLEHHATLGNRLTSRRVCHCKIDRRSS